MTAVLPHYKQGAASYQVSALVFGGQLVEPTTITAGTTDLTVKPAGAASTHVLGVVGKDANVLATANGTVGPAGAGPAADQVVGICTHPGGVAAAQLTQAIGGIGATSFFLGRVRIF